MDSNAITVCLPVDETEERSISCVINLKMGWVLSFILAITSIHPYMYTCVTFKVYWASKEAYHFFRVTFTEIHSIKMIPIWTQIR